MTQPESMGETIPEDVLESAREMAGAHYAAMPTTVGRILAGACDDWPLVRITAHAILAERERVRAILAHDAPWSPRRYIYDKTPERRIAALDKMDEAIG